MLTLTLNLSEEAEKDLKKLEELTEKPRNFHIQKAAVEYLRHANKLIKYYEKERKKGNKEYTTEDLLEHINLKEVDWSK